MSVNVETSLDLSPEIIKLRDSYLSALEKMPKAEHDKLIRQQLEKEENAKNRMALLACRTFLLREKTVVLRAEIDEDNPSTMLKKFREKTFSSSLNGDKEDKSTSENIKSSSDETANDWTRLKMLKSGNVNGVKFPPGVVIEVSKKESASLIADGSAEVVKISNENDATPGSENSNESDNKNEDLDKLADETPVEEAKDNSEEIKGTESKDNNEEDKVEEVQGNNEEDKVEEAQGNNELDAVEENKESVDENKSEMSKNDEEEALKALSEFGNSKAKK